MRASGAAFESLGKWLASSMILMLPVLALAQTDAERVYKQVAPAVVTVMAGDSTGTGFLVRDKRTFVTAAHVVDNGEIPVVRYGRGTLLQVRSMVVSKDLDLAILEVDDEVAATPIPLGDRETISPGTQVFAIGTALGALSHTLTDGMVSGIRRVGDKELLQVSSPMSPGMSGGPVLSRNGRVLGVISFTLTEGQNLNIAVAAKHVRRLLAAPLRPAEVVSEELKRSSSTTRGHRAEDNIGPSNGNAPESQPSVGRSDEKAQVLLDLLSEIKWWTAAAVNDAYRVYFESRSLDDWRNVKGVIDKYRRRLPLLPLDGGTADRDLLSRILQTTTKQERDLLSNEITRISQAMIVMGEAYSRAIVDLHSSHSTQAQASKSFEHAIDAGQDVLLNNFMQVVVSLARPKVSREVFGSKFYALAAANFLDVHFDSSRPNVAAIVWKEPTNSADLQPGDVIIGLRSSDSKEWAQVLNWKDVFYFFSSTKDSGTVVVRLQGGRTVLVRPGPRPKFPRSKGRMEFERALAHCSYVEADLTMGQDFGKSLPYFGCALIEIS